MWNCEVPGSVPLHGDLFSSRILITWQRLNLVICKIDHCTILQKRYFLTTKSKSSVFTSQRLHLVISKIDRCTILQKRQFLTTKNTKTKSSVCIWWFVKLITAQFYKRDNFSRQKLNPVSLLRSVCIWWLVKLITAQFYKKDNFSRLWRIRQLNPKSASGD